VENVGESSVQFADVMEKRDSFDTAQGVFVDAGSVPKDQRIRRDASYMFACLFVVGIDRIEERLHCRRAETLRSRTGSVLVV